MNKENTIGVFMVVFVIYWVHYSRKRPFILVDMCHGRFLGARIENEF